MAGIQASDLPLVLKRCYQLRLEIVSKNPTHEMVSQIASNLLNVPVNLQIAQCTRSSLRIRYDQTISTRTHGDDSFVFAAVDKICPSHVR